jgi:hypothetical protein
LLISHSVIFATSACGAAVRVAADGLALSCEIVDSQVGVREIYVVYTLSAGAEAVRFRLESSLGMTMSYLSEVHHVPDLGGDTQGGVTFCFGQFLAAPILLATVTYMAYGTSAQCSEIVVAPYPGSNTIDVIEYEGTHGSADGSHLIVNPNYLCADCDDLIRYGPPDNPYDFCQPVGTDVTTWGRIKAIR